jgi:hypothetical protein
LANVSISIAAIQQAENICQTAIGELYSSSQKLKSRFQEAGEYWSDEKYKQLGVIIDDCSSAMKPPIDELFACIVKLQEIEKAFVEYESTNLYEYNNTSSQSRLTRGLALAGAGVGTALGVGGAIPVETPNTQIFGEPTGVYVLAPEEITHRRNSFQQIEHMIQQGQPIPIEMARELSSLGGAWATGDRRRREQLNEIVAINTTEIDNDLRPAEYRE